MARAAPAGAYAGAEPRQDPCGLGAPGRPAAHVSHDPRDRHEREDHDRACGRRAGVRARAHDRPLHLAAPGLGQGASEPLRGTDLRGGVRRGVAPPRAVPRRGRRAGERAGHLLRGRHGARLPLVRGQAGGPRGRRGRHGRVVGRDEPRDGRRRGDRRGRARPPGARLDRPGGRHREGGHRETRQDRGRAGTAGRRARGDPGAREGDGGDGAARGARLGRRGSSPCGRGAGVPSRRRAHGVRRALRPDVRRARGAQRGGGDRRGRVGARDTRSTPTRPGRRSGRSGSRAVWR